MVVNQLSSSCFIQQFYETTAQLFHYVAKTNKETEKDPHFSILVTHLDALTIKVKDLKVMLKKKDRYILLTSV